ncbi:unnamed protein product, partial [Phaeothamnion confervicola]
MRAAAGCGEGIAVLQWGLNKKRLLPDSPHSYEVCLVTAKNGKVGTLHWACSYVLSRDKEICYSAATKGHLAVLKYAHETGCPRDANTVDFAARCGDFDTVKF